MTRHPQHLRGAALSLLIALPSLSLQYAAHGSGVARAQVPYYSQITNGVGVDACDLIRLSTSQMQNMIGTYMEAGIYIGGNSLGYTPITSMNWVDTVAGEGWGLMPIWVAYQSPCAPGVSIDPSTAEDEGWWEADKAAAAAQNAGFGFIQGNPGVSSIIYLDIEGGFDTSNPSCDMSALKAYVTGWSNRLPQVDGFKAGVYSSPDVIDQFASLSSVPAAVYPAQWPYNSGTPEPTPQSVWNLNQLPNNYWSYDQRIRQYEGSVAVWWSGYGWLTIDGDCGNGDVSFTSTGQPNPFDDLDGYPNNDETGGGPAEDESSTTVCP